MPIMEPDELLTELREIRADLRAEFADTVLFRQRSGAKYPIDSRNARAVQLLNKCLDTVDDLSDDMTLAYAKAIDGQLDDTALDSYMRAVGFRASFSTAAEFVQSFIADPERFVTRWKDAIKGT